MFRVLRPFEYIEAESVDDAVELLARYGADARVIAGGTDLVISMKKRELAPKYLIAIGHLPELSFLELDPDGALRVGPLSTHAVVGRSPLVKEHFEMLATASNEVGTPQVRNMGTIGGNVCKAGPSQDTPPVLIALEAILTLKGPRGARTVPMGEFCTGPFCTILSPDEVLTEIRIPPLPEGSAGCYKWCTKITSVDETLAGAGVVLTLNADGTCRDVRIGLGSVAPTAIRARQAEDMLRGTKLDPEEVAAAAETAFTECMPRSRAGYRRHMVRVMVKDAVNELKDKITGERTMGDAGEGAR